MSIINRLFNKKTYDVWEYGTCNNTPARRHKIKGNVQMKIWKAGEQGHSVDFWCDFDSSWWNQFKPSNNT